ncbi:potassium channel family protein [Pseudodonghicola xiamenensis]|uniref:Ion transporter n=1 Tax=Pseudodonghicola xiamenensis TaxID=337702 RepID=A0A8J3H6A3_9RHOB|nr:potassium channel family protein [Pseudodonghicola xiamenensis]GHG86954.1 ion transporter [Pseudodonghicola xiamenensis]
MTDSFKLRLDQLYTSDTRLSVRFRYALILFDAVSILYFIVTAPFSETLAVHLVNSVFGAVILLDFAARFWLARDRWHLLRQLYTLADIVVIAVLILDPFLSHSLAFLRILRGLRLIHSYHLLGDLRRDSEFFRRREDAVIAAINLVVFLFTTASAAYVMFFDHRPGFSAYIDALYFTVATLTTTGFGDITLVTPAGKLFSIFVMVFGVALFVNLARALFQPQKVRFTCPDCGLLRHDPDAVHCKHCGRLLNIPTEGAD